MEIPKKTDWAEEKPSSDSEDSKEEVVEEKHVPQEKEEYHSSRRSSYRGERSRRRRGGRDRRDYKTDSRSRTLHPSYYLDVIAKAKAPYEIKILIDKGTNAEAIIKHFGAVNTLCRKKNSKLRR
jgi:hypothetical protein